ncbi:MAG: CvpA family protein, partial [Synergistaceae bacterium]|nr:CvpA family protein [Synergistaceae bacterium]
MSAADIALILIGCFFVIRGIFRGLSGEILSLLSVVGGFYCSMRFYASPAAFLAEKIGAGRLVSTAVSMTAIFFLVFGVFVGIDKIVKKMLSATNLSFADKTAGGISGLVKLYVILLLVLVAGMIMSPVTGDEWLRKSKLLTGAAYTWPIVYPALDGLGVLPDLAELQNEAKRYIIQQASGSLFRPVN